MHLPKWFKVMAVIGAVLIAGILIGGILSVPYRFVKSPHGYEMPRVHYNTKNTTRFFGDNLNEVAARISQAVYPATSVADWTCSRLTAAPSKRHPVASHRRYSG